MPDANLQRRSVFVHGAKLDLVTSYSRVRVSGIAAGGIDACHGCIERGALKGNGRRSVIRLPALSLLPSWFLERRRVLMDKSLDTLLENIKLLKVSIRASSILFIIAMKKSSTN